MIIKQKNLRFSIFKVKILLFYLIPLLNPQFLVQKVVPLPELNVAEVGIERTVSF